MEQGYKELVRRLDDLLERFYLTEVEYSELREQARRERATKAETPGKNPRLDQGSTGEGDPTEQVSEGPQPDLVAQKARELEAAEAVLERKRIELEEAEQAEQERLKAEAAAELQAQEAEREELERLRAQQAEREELERLRAQQAERQELEQLRVEKAALEAERERLEEEREEAETERKRLQEEREEAETERTRLQEERKQSEGPLDQERRQESSDEATPVSGDGPTPRNRRTTLAAVGAGIAAIVILLLVTRGDSENPTTNPVEPMIAPTTTVPATTQAPTTTIPATTQAPTTTTVLSAAATTTTTSTSTLDEDTRVLTLDYSWGACDAWGPCDEVETLQALLGVSADGVYGPGTRSAHLAELERRALPTSGVPLPPTTTPVTTVPVTTVPVTTVPVTTVPVTTVPVRSTVSEIKIVEPDPTSVVSIPRGEDLIVRWTVKSSEPILRTWGEPGWDGSDVEGFGLTSLSVLYTPWATLIAGTKTNGTWEGRIDTTSLASGVNHWQVRVWGPDGAGGEAYLGGRPGFSFEVEPDGERPESDGPALTLLGVSPTHIDNDNNEITVRWKVEDESGLDQVSHGPTGFTTAFRSKCARHAHVGTSSLYGGLLSEGSVVDGVFEATLDWDSMSSYVYGSTCSLHFLNVDRWGNWERDDFYNVYTISDTFG